MRLCHKEHKGPEYDLFAWQTFGGQSKFAHDLSGFPLTGRHSVVECAVPLPAKTATGRPSFLIAPTRAARAAKSPRRAP